MLVSQNDSTILSISTFLVASIIFFLLPFFFRFRARHFFRRRGVNGLNFPRQLRPGMEGSEDRRANIKMHGHACGRVQYGIFLKPLIRELERRV